MLWFLTLMKMLNLKHAIKLTIIFLLYNSIIYAQDEDLKKSTLSIGIQTRITPIYQLKNPSSGIIPNTNLLSQGDKHYSGPALIFGWQKNINNNLEISLNPSVRWDYLYDIVGFGLQNDPQYYYKTKKTFVLDTYMDIKYFWHGRKTRKSLGLGFVIGGIGTGYLEEQEVSFSNNLSYLSTIKQDYLFPAIYTSLGLKFADKIFCELKMGYCWANPDYIIKNNFFFPELRISYDVFNF